MSESDSFFIDTSGGGVLVRLKEFEVGADDGSSCAMKIIDQIFHADEIFSL